MESEFKSEVGIGLCKNATNLCQPTDDNSHLILQRWTFNESKQNKIEGPYLSRNLVCRKDQLGFLFHKIGKLIICQY